MENPITRTFGISALIRRVASTLFIMGIEKSMTTT
jgi:hypothetical protein